ncbi:uracil-DNA glycosylase [Piscinibacter sakaiensis]|uniref:Type-4 uracil-DNA glycosylase n=1 Tax=Piscinibacter sakaiensis TaxID=1547922 RepID=A0A0K8P536_PISS1|nr:uracil-DNA glycosylase [Piscinibacter sakaiensis]GAP37752.1 uracil-DNA glycosylase, family 4 [Piscinibacter sakaiensis]
MSWDERQRRMLAELGIPPWLVPAGPPAAAGAGAEDGGEHLPPDAPDPVPVAASAVADRADPVAAVPRGAPAAAAGAGAPVAAPGRPAAVAPAPLDAAPGPRPGRGGLAALDWPALRAEVAACTACGLCQGRTQTVFGVGHPQAHWMIVGEAPGEQEDRQGEPFVGRSGQLLDSLLQSIGLTRAEAPPQRQVYIANTLKCRPPGNRNPTPEELLQCEPFLVRQIALVQPRLILAMGRFAVQALLRSSEPIGRLRGRVHRYQGVPLVVTYHPAYLLRNPLDKARAWDDLCLAAETAAASDAAAPAN